MRFDSRRSAAYSLAAMTRSLPARFLLGWMLSAFVLSLGAAQTFTVVTYNVENYLDAKYGTRPEKPAAGREKIREHLRLIQPDVIAFQEMGNTNALLELRASLKAEGLDFPHWEHVSGWDTNIHVAVLSRFPITARRPHTKDTYLLQGRRLHVSRGFAEVDIQVNATYTFTLFTAHLKSKRPISEADQAEMREQEAILLREKIDARLKTNPNANLVVVGDFNDTKDSKPVRALIGRGRTKLVDTRPAERNGDSTPARNPAYDPPNITWTYFYGKEDSYSRIDYILLSPGMAREWQPEGTYVLSVANWGAASDHRPVVARFVAEEK
jgi:endonuclease/exonuclease/phosphatase family metal-dependent hydrolase